MPIVRIIFIFNQIQWQNSYLFFGIPIIQKHRKSLMVFGENLQLRSTLESNPLGANHPVIFCTWQPGAILQIGNNFGMTGGSIVVAEKIMIGNRVNVGANTIIVDTDFHSVDSIERFKNSETGQKAAVLIEDDVFIGMNCLILKGVTIGKGSVIGAGSVVTANIPPGVIAAGNPARVIRPVGQAVPLI